MNIIQNRPARIGRVVLASTAAATLAVGIGVVGATQVQAADNFKLFAPNGTVPSGQDFTLVCKLPKHTAGWTGSPTKVKEQGVGTKATGTVGSKGNCTMNLALTGAGTHQIRVVVKGGNNILKSQWVSVFVG